MDTETTTASVEYDGQLYTLAVGGRWPLTISRDGQVIGYLPPRELRVQVPVITWEPAFLAEHGRQAWELRGVIVARYRQLCGGDDVE